MAEVVLEDVSKRYEHGEAVVDRFNLVVKHGEFLVLVGPSGCGKSTTLRMIAGLEEITSGIIKIDGRCVNTVPPKDRDIAMVFQNYALYPHMSVYDNMAFGLKLRGIAKREIETRVREAANILGLDALLTRLPKQLSGGQRQRVAVGRAIVRKPKVFLFDEPLSNLDAKMRVEMRSELSRLHRRLGATMIYVTHDQVEAMTMGNRIVVMSQGQVQQVAPPLEVYRQPANRFVASFIGTPPMNFLSGHIVRQEYGAYYFCHLAGKIAVRTSWARVLELYKERDLIMGFRPEALDVQTEHVASESMICGTVDVVEPMGAETFLQVVMAGGARIVARVSAEHLIIPGCAVSLPLDPAGIRFFDGASGCAISDVMEVA